MVFVTSSLLLPVVRPGATSSVLAPFVAMVFVTSSFLLTSSKARSLVASLLLRSDALCY